jgi:glycosyltransferase involved in cell wall biosynthesis
VLDVELNPMLVRAALGTLKKLVLKDDGNGADAMKNNPLYQAYLKLVRPAEGRIAEIWPEGLAFQNVIVARRPVVRRKLSLTVGMISMNEAGAVGGVIEDIKKHAPDAEVLLVDSSKDETPQIAESKGARVVRQFPPRGYGNAMHRLLYEARTDAIVTMDCDGTYPADQILPLLRLLEEGADLVNATRTRQRPTAMPLPNYIANRVFAATAHVMHGTPTTDLHSGMRAYRTSMLRGIDVDPAGPALPVELLVVPARLGYRIIEIEIPYHERIGTSTLQRFDSTKWTFRRLLRGHPGARVRSAKFENR